MTSDPETLPRPALPEMNDEIPEKRTNIKDKSGDSLWRRWIIKQTLQNCGELSSQ